MKNKLFKTSIIFAFITLIGRIIGMLKEMILSSTFGANNLTDAYNIAMTIPNMLYMIGISAIMVTFIPNYYEVKESKGEEEAVRFSNKLLITLLTIAIIMLIITYIFTKKIVFIMAPNFDIETSILTVRLTRITLINIIFMVLTAVLSSILRISSRFIETSIMPILPSLFIIVYLLIANDKNIEGVTIVTSISFAIQFIILIPGLRGIGYKFKVSIYGHNDRIKKVLKSIIPLMFGLAVQQISVMVDKIIGSYLKSGVITSLDLANKVNSVIYGVVSSTLITVYSPILSKTFLNDDKSEWLETIKNIIIYTMIILIPATIGVLILNNNLIALIYKRGNFTAENLNMVSSAFYGYAIQLPFLSVRDIIGQAFYSMKDTKTPSINGIQSVIINILLTLILSRLFGIIGIAIGTSISLITACSLLIIKFKNRFNNFKLKYIVISCIKIFISSIVMGGVLKLILNTYLYRVNSNILIIISSMFIGILVYTFMTILLNIKEVTDIFKILKERLKRL